jgi:hypothetical protein
MQHTDTETQHPGSPFRPLTWGVTAFAFLAAVLFRIVPHPPNLFVVGALGLYGGARLPFWQALLLPLCAMGVSDVVLSEFWGYEGFNPFVYGAFALYVVLGRLVGGRSPWRVAGASLLGSVLFFLITNFGMWYLDAFSPKPVVGYPPTWEGLLSCYLAGLVFFQYQAPFGFFANTVVGDLFFTGLLFGLHAALARSFFPAERLRWSAAPEVRSAAS